MCETIELHACACVLYSCTCMRGYDVDHIEYEFICFLKRAKPERTMSTRESNMRCSEKKNPKRRCTIIDRATHRCTTWIEGQRHPSNVRLRTRQSNTCTYTYVCHSGRFSRAPSRRENERLVSSCTLSKLTRHTATASSRRRAHAPTLIIHSPGRRRMDEPLTTIGDPQRDHHRPVGLGLVDHHTRIERLGRQ
jgi:hypothetical protein